MQLRVWQSKLLTLWQQRNGYLVFAVTLLLINFIQVIVIFSLSGRWHTVVVPANFSQTVWLSQSTVSDSYLAEMTQYVVTLLLDVTPESAAFQREALLRHVAPEVYGRLKTQLITNEDDLKAKSASTAFYPVAMKVDPIHLSVLMTGDLATFIGQEHTSTVRKNYLAHYRYRDGRLLLESFREEDNHEIK